MKSSTQGARNPDQTKRDVIEIKKRIKEKRYLAVVIDLCTSDLMLWSNRNSKKRQKFTREEMRTLSI